MQMCKSTLRLSKDEEAIRQDNSYRVRAIVDESVQKFGVPRVLARCEFAERRKTQQFVRFFDLWPHIFLTVEDRAVRIAAALYLDQSNSGCRCRPNSASQFRKAQVAATSCYPVCPEEGVR